MEWLIENLKDIFTNPWVLIFGGMSLIEWVPIKIYPWKWLGRWIFGGIRKDMQSLREEITDMKVQNWRWNVLDFANSCKNGRRHTLDEWKHTVAQLAEYENYIERNEITNGVFEEDARYLRDEYQRHCRENDFL
jgi:hypothetical protein